MFLCHAPSMAVRKLGNGRVQSHGYLSSRIKAAFFLVIFDAHARYDGYLGAPLTLLHRYTMR